MTEAHLPPGGIAWDQTLGLTAADGVRLRGGVWRGGTPVGKVRVSRVDTEAMKVVCDVTAVWSNQRIHKGDFVAF